MGLVASFVRPALTPCACWGDACQSEKALAWRENTVWSCVLDCGRVTGMYQKKDKNTHESEEMITNEGQIISSCKRRMIFLFTSTILLENCHFMEEFFNSERRRINNNQRHRSDKRTERIQRHFTTNSRTSTRTGQSWKKESRFRGTHTVPYACWGGECRSEREHQH